MCWLETITTLSDYHNLVYSCVQGALREGCQGQRDKPPPCVTRNELQNRMSEIEEVCRRTSVVSAGHSQERSSSRVYTLFCGGRGRGHFSITGRNNEFRRKSVGKQKFGPILAL